MSGVARKTVTRKKPAEPGNKGAARRGVTSPDVREEPEKDAPKKEGE